MLSTFLAARRRRARAMAWPTASVHVETLEDRALPNSSPIVPSVVPPDGWAVYQQISDLAGNTVIAGSAPDGTYPSGAGSNLALARYTPDGKLDPTFGNGGLVVTAIDYGADAAHDVAVQPDGMLVIAGAASPLDQNGMTLGSNFVVARYTADGVLDAGFGNGGIVDMSFGGIDSADAVTVNPDGTILASGTSATWYGPGNYGVYFGNPSTSSVTVQLNADGSLDTSFGNGGEIITTPPPDTLIPSDPGTLMVGGTSPGGDGSTTPDPTSLLPASWTVSTQITQPDGKLVVVGSATDDATSGQDFAVARFNADGSLDTTFGNDGMIVTPFATQDFNFAQADAVDLQPDGSVVVGGSAPGIDANGNEQAFEFTIVRYTADGLLDGSFGNGGVVQVSFGGDDNADTVTVQPDGTILTSGTSAPSGGGIDGTLSGTGSVSDVTVQLNADGSLVTSFGNGGEIITAPPPDTTPADPTSLLPATWTISTQITQPDGKLVVAGSATDDATSGQDFAVARFNADGSLDTSFGDGGMVVTPFATQDFNSAQADAVDLQPDGSIVVGGSAPGIDANGNEQASEFTIVRYTADGVLDSNFGTGGIVQVSFGGEDNADSVTAQADGTIFATGTSFNTDFSLDVAVQLNADGSFDTSYGNGGQFVISRQDYGNLFEGGVPLTADFGGSGPRGFEAPPPAAAGAGSDRSTSPLSMAAQVSNASPVALPQTTVPQIPTSQDTAARQVAVLVGGSAPQVVPTPATSGQAPTGSGASVAPTATPANGTATPVGNRIESGSTSSRLATGDSTMLPIGPADADPTPSDPNQDSGEAAGRDAYFARLPDQPITMAVPSVVDGVIGGAVVWPEVPALGPPLSHPVNERNDNGFGNWQSLAAVAAVVGAFGVHQQSTRRVRGEGRRRHK
jgi:uncharacterized delta-60 repeat protein